MTGKRRPLADEPWAVHYFRRHRADDSKRNAPAQEFLRDCPPEVRAHLVAVLKAVADAPPPRFAGGLQWRAMHGDMRGWFEARDRHGSWLYRVFCLLERDGAALGLGGPSVVLVAGMRKPNETAFTKADYAGIRALGDEFRARAPRSIVE